MRAGIAYELGLLALFHGSATAVASLVLTAYVFALLLEQHDELRTSLRVQYSELQKLVQ